MLLDLDMFFDLLLEIKTLKEEIDTINLERDLGKENE
jgi:hypothetical protein